MHRQRRGDHHRHRHRRHGFAQGATAGFDPGDTTVRAVIDGRGHPDLHVHEHRGRHALDQQDDRGRRRQLRLHDTGTGVPADLRDRQPRDGTRRLRGQPQSPSAPTPVRHQDDPGDRAGPAGRSRTSSARGTTDAWRHAASTQQRPRCPVDAVDVLHVHEHQAGQLVIEKVVVNDDGGTATVGDFGITTSAGALVFGAAGRGPGRHLHLHRRDAPGRARHVHPRRARAGRLRAVRLDLHQRRRRRVRRGQRHPRRGRPDRSPARSPTTTSRSASSSRRSSSTTTAAAATVGDFGITTSAGALVFGAAGRGPGRHLHLHRGDARGRARHVHPRRARAGRLRADRLDLHQRRRRRLRRGQRHPRRGRPDRSPARSPTTTSRSASSSRRSSSTTTAAAATVGDFGITTSAGALVFGAAGRGPGRHLHLHRGDARGRARHVHPRRARAGGLRAVRLDLHQRRRRRLRRGQRHPRRGRPDRSPARSPTTTSRSASSSRRSSSTTTAAAATVGDFGITTSAGALVFGAAGRGPGRHLHLHRGDARRSRPARTPSPSSRWRATRPTAWTCTNGDGGAFDAGSVTLAAGDPTGHLLDHQRRPAGQPRHREGRRQRRRRHATVVDDFGITTSAGALVFGAAGRGPGRHLHLHRGDARRSRPARTPSPSSRWRATRRPPGPAPTAAAAPSTRAASPSPRATRPVTCSITNDDQPVSLVIEKVVVNDDGGSGDRRRLRDHHQRRRARLRAAVEAPADTFTYTAATLAGRARHVHPRRARAGGLRAVRLDLHQRRRRRLRRGQRHPRRGRPDRSPARSPTTTSGDVLPEGRLSGDRWPARAGHKGRHRPAIRASRGWRCCSRP